MDKKKNRVRKSKRSSIIPHITECTYYIEKTRRDYLRQCSEHFNKKLYDSLVDMKRWWMQCEDTQVALEKSNNENVADYIKNGVLRRKLYPILHQLLGPKKQEKKKKKRSKGKSKPPKKKDDLLGKVSVKRHTRSGAKSINAPATASDPFGVKTGRKGQYIDKPASAV